MARGTFWNFVGYLSPIIFALVAVPVLVRHLGTDRLGFLTIAWAVMAYFGAFDLGLARATTLSVARLSASGEGYRLRSLVSASILLHAVLGAFGGALLALLSGWLARDVLSLPAVQREEAGDSLLLLSASVPLIVLTAALRGVLEGFSQFDVSNGLRIASSASVYLLPMVVSYRTPDLRFILAAVLLTRGLVLAGHAWACRRLLAWPGRRWELDRREIRTLLPFGGWLAVSNLMPVVIAGLDRLALGARASMEAVAHYAVPYEVITKLWIVSGSVLAAASPLLGAAALDPGGELRRSYERVFNAVAVLALPLAGFALLSVGDLLTLWLGAEFAGPSVGAARWLSVGALAVVLSSVPATVLQASGSASAVAKRQLLLLPAYAATVWLLARGGDVALVALAWAARGGAEALLLFRAARGRIAGTGRMMTRPQTAVCLAFLGACWAAGAAPLDPISRPLVCALALTLFVAWEWNRLLAAPTRALLRRWGSRLLGREAGGLE